MKKETIEIVNFEELRTELCKEMGIDEKYFRDYHDLVGGEYKDFWHVWLWWFCDEGGKLNDTIQPTYYAGEIWDEEYETWLLEELGTKGYEWALPMFKAAYKIFEEHGGPYTRINIKYKW
jgi:hypothetical protein